MEPSLILYKSKGKFHISPIYYDEIDLSDWYKRMRNRVDGLSIVFTVKEFNKNLEDPSYKAYLNGEIDSYQLPD